MHTEGNVMICLVGGQPISNYLPIKALEPQCVILLKTDWTAKTSERLKTMLEEEQVGVKEVQVDAYDLQDNITKLGGCLKKLSCNSNLIFNITGGTKVMVVASLEVARRHNGNLCYLRSEGEDTGCLQIFGWSGSQLVQRSEQEVPVLIDLDTYLRLYVGDYKVRNRNLNHFECLVGKALRPYLCEVKQSVWLGPSLEIDLIIRNKNRIGIVEIKTGKNSNKKEPIDQLNTAGNRDYLGTYVKKILIVTKEFGSDNRDLAEEQGIEIIELTNSSSKFLNEADRELLINRICEIMGVSHD